MSMGNREYICLPCYSCHCDGKPVSKSTMLRHRRNTPISDQHQGTLPWGPTVQSGASITQFFNDRREQESLSLDQQRLLDDSSNYPLPFHHPIPSLGAPENATDFIPYDANNINPLEGQSAYIEPVTSNFTSHPQRYASPCDQSHTFDHDSYYNERINVGQSVLPESSQEENFSDSIGGHVSMDCEEDSLGSAQHEDDITVNGSRHSSSGFHVSTSSEQDCDDENSMSFHCESVWENNSCGNTPLDYDLDQCRKWIDLQFKHGLPETVMNDILGNLDTSFNSWKQVKRVILSRSLLSGKLQKFPVCSGHYCFATINGEIREACPECAAPRPNIDSQNNRGHSSMSYIPLLPRIEGMLTNQTAFSTLYHYTAETCEPNHYSDFTSGLAFKHLCSSLGGLAAVKYDIFLSVSTDGFQPYQKTSHCVWPILAVVLNLPTDQRYLIRNLLPIAFVPGPRQPTNLQSFLMPLINEINSINENGGTEIRCYDGCCRKIKVHVLYFTGDLPAVSKVAGLVGHNGVHPCRFCNIKGVYDDSRRHYYYPSFLSTDTGTQILYSPNDLPTRTPEACKEVITSLQACQTAAAKNIIRKQTGISNDSVLFQLATIHPYRSFPIDLMHLVLDIGKELLLLWINDVDEDYHLTKESLLQIDARLVNIGAGISSQLDARPRPLSMVRNWKASEVKRFILSYSMIVLQTYLPDIYLRGWHNFVKLCELCHMPLLSCETVSEIQQLSITFFNHYETNYYKFNKNRIHYCKYIFHLILHLNESIIECGPLPNYSQYTTERYIGWIGGRLNARLNPSASFYENALFCESYKLCFKIPFYKNSDHKAIAKLNRLGGFQLTGGSHQFILTYRHTSIRHLLKDYLHRILPELSNENLQQLFASQITVTYRSSIHFIAGGTAQKASAFMNLNSLQESTKNTRANWFVALEENHGDTIQVRYGRILKLASITFDCCLVNQIEDWKSSIDVMILDWAGGQIDQYDQLFS